MAQWNPNYINQFFEYEAHDVVTAEEYNAILNKLCVTTDNITRYLQYLTEGGIVEVFPQFLDTIDEYFEETIKPQIVTYIDNYLTEVAGLVAKYEDAEGNPTTEKYLHW